MSKRSSISSSISEIKPGSLTDIIDSKNRIFIDKRALRSNYSLRDISDIKKRDAEIRTYFYFLKDIFDGYSPNNIFVYGKTGTGKTLLTKWVLEVIQKEADNRNIKLYVVNVNCEKSKTENAIWQNINDSLPTPDGEIKKKIGNSRSKHCNYFGELVNKYPGIIIIVLDELDKAFSPEIINNIIRTESEITGNAPCVIGITNDLELRERLPPHLGSALSEKELFIKPYDAEQLRDILEARAEIAFKKGTLESPVIPLCAAHGAQEHGDARKALDTLRIAGELAEMRESSTVGELDVRLARERLETDRILEVVKYLPIHSKMALMACILILHLEDNESTITKTYQIYKKICVEAGIESLSPRRITDLINELDQLGVIQSTLQYKGRYGRNKNILSVTSSKSCMRVLLDDYRLHQMAQMSFTEIIGDI